MNGKDAYDGWNAEGNPGHPGSPDGGRDQAQPGTGGRTGGRTGLARIVAPLVLGTAGVLLLVAVIAAISTLRTPAPDAANLNVPTSAANGSAGATTSQASTAAETATTGATNRTTTSATTSGTRTATTTGTASSAGGSSAATQRLNQIAGRDENRPQGQAYAILFDLADGSQSGSMKTEAGSSTWSASDILWLYDKRVAAWPGAVLQARPNGDKTSWRLTVSDPSWRTAADAQKWCDSSFAQYDGDARTERCRVPST